MPTNFGQKVESNDIAEWRAAGFDWKVEPKKLYTQDGTKVEGKVALTNSESGTVLGVVSDKYKIVQPEDMLQTFHEGVSRLGFDMECMGMYQGGKVIWGRADMHDSFTLRGNDNVKYYMYFITSMDGSVATHAFISTLRVYCMNALNVAQDRSDIRMSVRHSREYDVNSFMMKAQHFPYAKQEFEENMLILSEKHYHTSADFIELYEETIEPEPSEPKAIERWQRRVRKLYDFAQNSPGAHANPRSYWNFLNGYTYMVDHESRCRSLEAAHRNSVIGLGAKKKEQVMQSLVGLAKAA